MEYQPLPTESELEDLGTRLGATVRFERRIKGGLSTTTDVLAADGQSIVLRRHGPWWSENDIDVVAREAGAISAVATSGVPVPEVLWRDRREPFGCPALVTSLLPGHQVAVPADEESFGAQLAAAAFAIHGVAVTDELRPLLAPQGMDLERPPEVFQHPDAQRVLARIDELRPMLDAAPKRLIHGDFWPGNTLWVDGVLTGVVDWEYAGYSDPAADLAYSVLDMRYIGLEVAAQAMLDEYEALRGEPLETLDFWMAEGVARPMPDIAVWVPAWIEMGYPITDPDDIRAAHRRVIADVLG